MGVISNLGKTASTNTTNKETGGGSIFAGLSLHPVQKANTQTVSMPFSRFSTTQPQSQRQRLLSQHFQQKWYAGDMPTASETVARITQISKTNRKEAEELWSVFQQYQSDPSTPYYNPYTQATNKAINELSALGFDMRGGVTEKWIEDNAWLKNYYRMENGNTPLAPSKKSSAEENAAYWYYQILKNEGTTQKAENEWAALQEEISYWTKRKDRNYSDDEILGKIDWKKYPTLTDMDGDKDRGLPTSLNRSIGYSKDALKGVIWAARNGTTGDAMADSVHAVLGDGKGWKENKTISEKLNPSSAMYSPYSVGCTLDEAALYFGVEKFDKNWLEKNRGYLASDDATAQKMYEKVYNAEQTTLKAEEELKELWAYIDQRLKYNIKPDQIIDGMLDDYPTLRKLDASLKSGDLVDTTRAINYRKEDVEAEIQRRYDAKKAQEKRTNTVLRANNGHTIYHPDGNTAAIIESRNNAISDAAPIILSSGSDEDKIVLSTAPSSDFPQYMKDVHAALGNGNVDLQATYDSILDSTNRYAGAHYLEDKTVIDTVDQAQAALEAAQKKLKELQEQQEQLHGADTSGRIPGLVGVRADAGMSDLPNGRPEEETSFLSAIGYTAPKALDSEGKAPEEQVYDEATQRAIEEQQKIIEDATVTIEENQDAYVKAKESMANMEDAYAVAETVKELMALQEKTNWDPTAVMDYLYQFKDYQPTEYSAYSLYDAALAQGGTYEQVANAAILGRAQNQHRLDQINYLLGLDRKYFQGNITIYDADDPNRAYQVPADYIDNMKREQARLEREIKAADYFLLREQPGFEKTAKETQDAINKAYSNYVFSLSGTQDGYSQLDRFAANPNMDFNTNGESSTYMYALTQEERDTYMYLRGTKGPDAAKEYYDYLTNDSYGIIHTRLAQTSQEMVKKFAEEYPVLSTATSVFASIAQPMGFLYRAVKAVEGEEANPYSKYHSAGQYIGTVRPVAKESLSKKLNITDGSIGKKIFDIGFDAITSAGDSMLMGLMMGGVGIGGEAATVLGKLGLKATNALVHALPMGLGAASNAMVDAQIRGGTTEQQWLMGITTLFAETATEAITMGNITEAFKGTEEATVKSLKQLVVGTLKDMFLEEAPGEFINEYVESYFDDQIMKELSNRSTLIKEYEKTMSHDEAVAQADKDIFRNCVNAYIVGAVSGGFSDTAGHITSGQAAQAIGLEIQSFTNDQGMDASAIADRTNMERMVQDELKAQNEALRKNPDNAGTNSVGQAAEQHTNNEDIEVPDLTDEDIESPDLTDEVVDISLNEEPTTGDTTEPVDISMPEENATEQTQDMLALDQILEQEKKRIAMQASALQASLGEDDSGKTATIGAVLAGDNAGDQDLNIASAAAMHLANSLGVDHAVKVVRDIFLRSAEARSNMTDGIKNAIVTAALNQNGEAATALRDMANGRVSMEGIRQMLAASALEMSKPDVRTRIQDTVTENQIAARVKEKISNGALAGLNSYQESVRQANQVLQQAAQNVAEQKATLGNMADNLQSVTAEYIQNITRENEAAAREAAEKVAGQKKVVAEYEQSAANAQQKVDAAKRTLQTQQDSAMAAIRQEAQQEVLADQAAAQQAEAEQKAMAEAQKQVERDVQNENTLDADNYIDTFFPDATDEEKQKIRETFGRQLENAQNPQEIAKRKTFVQNLGKKFGVNIVVADTTEGGTKLRVNGSYDARTNTITLDTASTQSDAIYAVAFHELTHMAERSGTYDQLASALLRMKYGGNDAQLAADIRAKQQMYNAQLEVMAKADPTVDTTPLSPEDASKEIVADLTREVLFGDQNAIDALVAQDESLGRRILNAIKSFLKRLAGIDDPAITRLNETQRMFEKALKTANVANKGGRIQYYLNTGFPLTKDRYARFMADLHDKQWQGYSFIDGKIEGKLFDLDDALVYTDADDNIVHTIQVADDFKPIAQVIIEDARDSALGGDSFAKTRRILEGNYGEESASFFSDGNGRYGRGEIAGGSGADQGRNGQARGKGVSVQAREGTPAATDAAGEVIARELPGGTITKEYSLASWTEDERARVRKSLLKKGFTEADVDKWIADVDSTAAMIAADKERLDFTADPTKTMLKPNAEYVKTLDASTLCAKRLLYQGTFNEIQHQLPNTPLMPEDLIDLVNMMKAAGYEAPCGICYVESRRRLLGKFTQQWLDSYEGAYKPTIDEVTTTDGLEALRKSHPDTYHDFIDAMNKKGTMNPKVVQLRTDYRGEIKNLTKGQRAKILEIGGLRVQSFSDFETPHLLDMMQAVLDMSAQGLTAQAYTKVPNFAWAFGDTGIKINLSLIGEGTGLDANGNLIFSSTEGMDFEEAMRLRDRYSENVGTILVGMNDAHILAAMADPRIDFIIPFHKSGWSAAELAKMPELNNYTDYTSTQNERKIIGKNKNGTYKTEAVDKNFYPIDYWDYSKTGKENAETYLRMCAEDGRLPKFWQFLVDNGDGSFSLQPDGSTDGYWKTLIDGKMYDNDGNGSPQRAVTPNINMEEAARILNEYEGNANELPVAQDIVQEYVDKYKAEHPRKQYSLPSTNVLEDHIRQYISGGLGAFGEPVVRQRQFGSQTAQNNTPLHDEVKQYLRDHSSYSADTNMAQIERSIGWLQSLVTKDDPNGYQAAVSEVLDPNFDYNSADGQARMLTVLSMAAIQNDTASELAIADAYNQQGTEIGRALQARHIFAMMTPLGRIAILNNEMRKINQDYANKGKKTRVKLPPDLIDRAGRANTQEEFNKVRRDARKALAQQMPPTFKEKLLEWRMVCMLGNPRTHIRNILGNAIFVPTVKLKNIVAAGIEKRVLPKTEEHTKSVFAGKENRQFARADADAIKDILTGEQKRNPVSQIDLERKMFGTGNGILSKTLGKGLQAATDFTSWALEAEDWVFLRMHYTSALAGWMKANKLTPADLQADSSLLDRGRAYAINEAQKATYRDASEFANTMSKISRNGGIAGFLVDAALPFKKTPANILKRGIEYSPIGLLQTLATMRRRVSLYNAYQNGQLDAMPKHAMSPTQAIDRLASGLTGTGIAALGAFLASIGAVTVGFDEDKEELEKLEGKQKYALNVDLFGQDVSLTIDWAAPVCMPFFVGASIYEALSQENPEIDVGSVADSLLNITEPVFNLSMLDGVNSLLSVNSFGSGNAITQIGEKVVSNYATSYIPTLLGQVSRTIDPVRRKSYVESGASLSTWKYSFEQAQNKTPYSISNIPYRNPWGEEDRSDTWMAAFENMISPGYISAINESDLTQELERLYDATGEKSVLPKMPGKTLSAGGETIRLNAEQYDQLTLQRGTTAKKLIEDLMAQPMWNIIDDPDKASMIEDAWKYANQTANVQIASNAKMDNWVAKAQADRNPTQAIIDRHEERKKKEYEDGYRDALYKAIEDGDADSVLTSVEALRQAGKEDSAIRASLTSRYRPLYKQAMEGGDIDTALTIEDMLRMTGLGYKQKDFANWLKDKK